MRRISQYTPNEKQTLIAYIGLFQLWALLVILGLLYAILLLLVKG